MILCFSLQEKSSLVKIFWPNHSCVFLLFLMEWLHSIRSGVGERTWGTNSRCSPGTWSRRTKETGDSTKSPGAFTHCPPLPQDGLNADYQFHLVVRWMLCEILLGTRHHSSLKKKKRSVWCFSCSQTISNITFPPLRPRSELMQLMPKFISCDPVRLLCCQR